MRFLSPSALFLFLNFDLAPCDHQWPALKPLRIKDRRLLDIDRCDGRAIRVNGFFGVLFVLGHVAIIAVSADFQKVVSVPPAIFVLSGKGDARMKQAFTQCDPQSSYEVILDLAI